MKTKRIVAKTFEPTFNENPDWIGLIAADGKEQVEIIFETTNAPALAAEILASSQDAAKKIDPATVGKHLDKSMKIMPDAVGLRVIADGEVLCINVGSGAIFFRLTEPAKRALYQPR